MLRITALVAIGLLTGCASLPAEMAVDSPLYNQNNAGLVVGSLSDGGPYGTFLEFRNKATGDVRGWGPKDDYAAWLPAGDYEVTQLGHRRGTMGPYSHALQFTVKKGQINYVGEMVYGCSDLAQPTAVYGVKYCGLLALGTCEVTSPDVNVCVVDRQQQAIKYFLRQHPQQSSLTVRSALMK
ncbi:hypothetical protein SJI00_08270 [Pseudomonas sp. RP23018S]|uniref:hypothetical protein n=1 Tax=Pseudomonas sp. RP23018S TaxID=3096037 RepID=UPI002ACA7E82|nr:hypothetical protein [Pseudomonas sp. RP23018S]MDZ5602766.1 hypothetical protein [Pseudomonas sp. RP23018S]